MRTLERDHTAHDGSPSPEPSRGGAPGKSTLTSRLPPGRRSDAAPQPASDAPVAALQPPGEDPFGMHLIGSEGQPLDAATRALAERGFGCDLGRTRVHTGAAASASAAEHGAEAYALGDDVVFGEGRYQPDTDEGRWLLLHELAHVVQQDGQQGAPMRHALDGGSSDASEHAADHAADRILAGETGVGGSLARGPLAVSRFEKRLGISPVSPTVEVSGWITGPRSVAPILHEHGNVCRIPSGTEGTLELVLHGTFQGVVGGGVVVGPFKVERTVPYRFAPDGSLMLLEKAATARPTENFSVIAAGRKPAVTTAMVTDGSQVLTEVISFSDVAPSVDAKVNIGKAIELGGKLGGETQASQVAVSVDLQVDGPKPAPQPPPSKDKDGKGGGDINIYNDNRQTNIVIGGGQPTVSAPRANSVHFDHDKAELTPGAVQKLTDWVAAVRADQELVTALAAHRLQINIFGYASHSGTNEVNKQRSEQRAASVDLFLRGKFGAALNVATNPKGLGEASAAGPDNGRQDAQEQRVDISIGPPDKQP